MKNFSTRFPVKKSLTKQKMLEIFQDYYQHFGRNFTIDIQECLQKGSVEYVFGESKVSVILTRSGVSAIREQYVSRSGVSWCVDYILEEDETQNYFISQTYSEKTEIIEKMKESSVKPTFVKIIQDLDYCDYDYDLHVSGTAYIASKDDIKLVEDIFTGKKSYQMPIVFVSRNKRSTLCSLDVEKLAKTLWGIAHVVVESSSDDFNELAEKYGNEFPSDGKVCLFGSDGKRSIIVPLKKYTKETFRTRVFDFTCKRMISLLSDEKYSWGAIKSQKLLDVQEKVSEENKEMEKMYTDELTRSELVISQLQDEIKELKGRLLHYENGRKVVANEERGNVFLSCDEVEFYEGEIKDCILKVLEKEKNSLDDDSNTVLYRKYHILSSLLKNNDFSGNSDDFEKSLKSVFKKQGKTNHRGRSLLKELGFSVLKGSHDKLIYNDDPRYVFTMGNTPSDGRASKNAASIAIKTLIC